MSPPSQHPHDNLAADAPASDEPQALLDRTPLVRYLASRGLQAWADELQTYCQQRFAKSQHGKLADWIAAWERLPAAEDTQLDASGPAVGVSGAASSGDHARQLTETLMQFHPWRKGPFRLFGIHLDTEWRSDLKWERLAEAIDFRGQSVLDVGCGNGYYGWRMLSAGAEWVLGCEPFLLYVLQFEVMRRYAPRPERHFVVPLADHELPDQLQAFDIALSMGVLYHRPSPIEHLQKMAQALTPGRQLILETLIIDRAHGNVLVPEDRYAKMRNVWFIPSLELLELWLRRTGFEAVRVIDVTATTPHEQRRTDWMTFESLADFLDPHDPNRTIEGYPAPLRGMLVARRR